MTKTQPAAGGNAPALPARRRFLAGAAAAIPAAAVVSVPKPYIAAQHPDAELIALGTEMKSLSDALYELPPDDPNGDVIFDQLADRLFEIEDRINAVEARSVAGLAVKLRLLWHVSIENREEHRYGPQPDSDERLKAFWALIQNAEAMSGAEVRP